MNSFNSLISSSGDLQFTSIDDNRSHNFIVFTLILNVITFFGGTAYFVICVYLEWDIIGSDW